jgi:hypothetical protein
MVNTGDEPDMKVQSEDRIEIDGPVGATVNVEL